MALRPKFNSQQIKKFIEEKLRRIEDAVLSMLQRVGENFVTNARTSGNYLNQTGNLRSSIGYVILKNGFQYFGGDFVLTGDGYEGLKKGKSFLEEIIKEFNNHRGWVLIVVAGMEYAAAVESKKKDVLTGSSQIAKKELKQAMERITKKIDRL